MQVDLFVFHGFLQPLDEHVVAPGAAAVHADTDFIALQNIDEARRGKLRALVGVEDFGRSVPSDRLLEGLNA